jgi:hypothetical protein
VCVPGRKEAVLVRTSLVSGPGLLRGQRRFRPGRRESSRRRSAPSWRSRVDSEGAGLAQRRHSVPPIRPYPPTFPPPLPSTQPAPLLPSTPRLPSPLHLPPSPTPPQSRGSAGCGMAEAGHRRAAPLTPVPPPPPPGVCSAAGRRRAAGPRRRQRPRRHGRRAPARRAAGARQGWRGSSAETGGARPWARPSPCQHRARAHASAALPAPVAPLSSHPPSPAASHNHQCLCTSPLLSAAHPTFSAPRTRARASDAPAVRRGTAASSRV